MNKHEIFYWLSEGTALGITRDNALIPWDDDLDVSFMYTFRQKFIEKVLPELLMNGFTLDGFLNNNNFILLSRKNEKLDVDVVQKDAKYTTECNSLFPYLNNIWKKIYLNESFNIPGPEYLEFLYGKDWKTPRKDK
jgi:phosphorylcholine metabolism protein LicD